MVIFYHGYYGILIVVVVITITIHASVNLINKDNVVLHSCGCSFFSSNSA